MKRHYNVCPIMPLTLTVRGLTLNQLCDLSAALQGAVRAATWHCGKTATRRLEAELRRAIDRELDRQGRWRQRYGGLRRRIARVKG